MLPYRVSGGLGGRLVSRAVPAAHGTAAGAPYVQLPGVFPTIAEYADNNYHQMS